MIEIAVPLTNLGLVIQRCKHGGVNAVDVVIIPADKLTDTILMLEATVGKLKLLEEKLV